MVTSLNVDYEEQAPLNNSTPLDERILDVVRRARKEENATTTATTTVRPALLTSELGLSIEESTRELCGLLSAVGGGEDGASFRFERVEFIAPNNNNNAAANTKEDGDDPTSVRTTTTMVFTFPHDFEERAKRYRRRLDLKHKLHISSIVFVKALKVFTAFGLIISLAVLMIIGICLLVAAVVALARGGGSGHGGGRNHPLMHKLRYLFFQLRQILWLYAICGSAGDGQQDPFMREIAGDIAMTMSIFCGNPVHPFFWYRLGSIRTRWTRLRNSRGWGNIMDSDMINGVTMMRRESWGQNEEINSEYERHTNQMIYEQQQQRGLLSIAVEFLFGPNDTSSGIHNFPVSLKELEKWKLRASIIMSVSSKSLGSGVALRDLLPFVDNPPPSAEDPSAIREALKIVTYLNGKPAYRNLGNEVQSSGIDAEFCFPELVAEFDNQVPLKFSCCYLAPPSTIENENALRIFSILYKEDEEYNVVDSSINITADTPTYLYEQPFVLTELTREQFGQCVLLGLLNFCGVIWALNSMKPGGLLSIPMAGPSFSGSSQLSAISLIAVLKLLQVLRFYAAFFFALPLCRLVVVSVRNCNVQRRNKLRSDLLKHPSYNSTNLCGRSDL